MSRKRILSVLMFIGLIIMKMIKENRYRNKTKINLDVDIDTKYTKCSVLDDLIKLILLKVKQH